MIGFLRAKKREIGEGGYYAFWAVILFAKALNLSSEDLPLLLLMMAGLGFLGVKYLCTDWTKKSIVVSGALCALGILTWRSSGSTELLVTLAAIGGAKDVPLKKLVGFIFCLRLAVFLATVFMAATGIVENVYEFTVDVDGNLLKETRYYLGFIHPNYAQVSLFVLVCLYAYLRSDRLTVTELALMLVCNFALFHYTRSRTGMLLICLFCFTLAIFRRKQMFPLGKWLAFLPALLAAFTLLIPVFYGSDNWMGGLLHRLDVALTGRVEFVAHYLRDFPLTLFGDRAITAESAVVPLDCAYVSLLRQYGLVAFLLYTVGETLVLMRHYRQNRVALFTI
ncbi:MAG: hypothetical protein ACI4U2_02810, partial [Christensenellaceae bacterium]